MNAFPFCRNDQLTDVLALTTIYIYTYTIWLPQSLKSLRHFLPNDTERFVLGNA